MAIRRWLRTFACGLAVLLGSLAVASGNAHAAEITGTIAEIAGDSVYVELPAPAAVKAGDAASIGFTVEGLGAVPLRGTWRVESVAGTRVVLRPAGPGTDQPRVGQIATFRPADLPPSAAPAAPPPGDAGASTVIGEESGWVPSPRPESALEPEVSGEALRFVQRRLQELGYDPGPADGVIGPRTRAAIREFQRTMGMKVDGRATPLVHLALSPVDASSGVPGGVSDEGLFRSDESVVQQGTQYYYGLNGKPKDPARACALFEVAATHGHPVGQYQLGVCYAFGNGRPRNYVTARGLFEKAAALRYPQALYNLSVLYEKGWGVTRDPQRALAFMHEAAGLGLVEAYGGLGEYYLSGTGTAPSRDTAIYWHQQGARAGLPLSQEALRKLNVGW